MGEISRGMNTKSHKMMLQHNAGPRVLNYLAFLRILPVVMSLCSAQIQVRLKVTFHCWANELQAGDASPHS